MKSFQFKPQDPLDPDRLPYIEPAIIIELDLETRAGSPLDIGEDPFDLTGLGAFDDLP